MSARIGEDLQAALSEEIVDLLPGPVTRGLTEGGPEGEAGFRLTPRDGEELAACLHELSTRAAPVVVRGGGTRQDLGNPLREVVGVLSTQRMAGIDELDTQDGVLHVAAGTRLSEVAAKVRAEGWELPLDPPGSDTTIGGAIAASATGPRRAHFGPPRSCILGLEVSLASGERTRCGGRVVKNVTGYDMAKLYAGSLGSLGVIESAWLRLRPAPEEIRSLVGTFATPARSQAFESALVAARRESVRVAALVFGAAAAELGAPSGDVAEGVLVAECAGDAAVVSRDVDWLGRTAGARIVPEEARVIGRLRGLQGSGPLRARLAVLPSDLERAVRPLVEAGIGVIALPGVGFVYALANEASEVEWGRVPWHRRRGRRRNRCGSRGRGASRTGPRRPRRLRRPRCSGARAAGPQAALRSEGDPEPRSQPGLSVRAFV